MGRRARGSNRRDCLTTTQTQHTSPSYPPPRFGTVIETTVCLDRNTQRSKGFAFVIMSDMEACNRAMAEPSQNIDGRMTHTNFASRGRGPKRPRVANGPSGYGAPPAAYPAYAAPQYAAPQYAPQYAAPPAAQYAPPQYAADPNAAYAAQYVGI